jgi:hypothetical protein
MQRSAIVLALLLGATAPAFAAVDLNLSMDPALEPVPGSPVYYAPDVNANYFAYNGLYWVFDGNDWYSSPGYDGPWGLVPMYDVPAFLWDVPVGYYRHAPGYFDGWRGDAAPHWGEHFGSGWEHRGEGRGGFQHGVIDRGGERFGGGIEHFGNGGGERFGGGGEHFGGGGEHGGGGGEHGGGGGHGR